VAAARAAIVARLREQIERITDDMLREIFAEVPAYETNLDAALLADVREHIREHNEAILASLESGHPVSEEELLFVRRHAAARVGRLSVRDFVHAFQIGQRVVLDECLALAVDDRSRRAVLSLVTLITRYFDVVIAHAADVYLEAEQTLASTGERVRRDLLEDLLSGQMPAVGPALDAARSAGLSEDAPCVVIAARPTATVEDPHALRGAATALARTARAADPPLAVVRHDEIVVVVPTRSPDAGALAGRVRDAQKRLESGGLPLAIGMSTVHGSVEEVSDAYREAVTARGRLTPAPGVVALPAMTMFDYLTGDGDATARRMMSPAIARFVREDRSSGGGLIATLHAYAAADLNVKEAAESLHIHVNTAHYRLGKIAERTGCDLRRISDVIELLIATRVS
jgi:sugar diacid utilization regulator